MTVPIDIRQIVSGVVGSFLMHHDGTARSDFDIDLDYITANISCLKTLLKENHEASRMYVYGQKRNMILYLDGEFTLGVMISKETNIHLLHRVVNKVLSGLKSAPAEPSREGEPLKEAHEFFSNL